MKTDTCARQGKVPVLTDKDDDIASAFTSTHYIYNHYSYTMSMSDSLHSSGKLPHNTALLFLIAAKAATITVPSWVSEPTGGWWTTAGLIWLKSLAERVSRFVGSDQRLANRWIRTAGD